MRFALALLVLPVLANAGVDYDVSIRAVDQSDLGMAGPNAPPVMAAVTRYFVDDGKVRVGGLSAKHVYLFKGRTMDVIDNPARSAHVLQHATLAQLAAHYADSVRQLEDAAAHAPAAEHAEAERKATDMKEVSDRMMQPVARDYKVTTRFESVDGRACRVWEERENGAKRLELCVAPVASVPGGAEILGGMKLLSQFRQGSDYAFGIDFGRSEWWPDFSMLGGVPLLIREFKYDSLVSETMVNAIHQGSQNAALFDVPAGYQIIEGPEYTQWYVR